MLKLFALCRYVQPSYIIYLLTLFNVECQSQSVPQQRLHWTKGKENIFRTATENLIIPAWRHSVRTWGSASAIIAAAAPQLIWWHFSYGGALNYSLFCSRIIINVCTAGKPLLLWVYCNLIYCGTHQLAAIFSCAATLHIIMFFCVCLFVPSNPHMNSHTDSQTRPK